MDPFLVLVLVLFVMMDVLLLKSLRIVPQGEEWKIDRLGKPFKTFKPGLILLVPFIDKVAERMTLQTDKSSNNDHKKPTATKPINLFTK